MNINPNINRREALARMGAASLLALGLWPGALNARAARPAGAFRFLVINDTHYLSPQCGEYLEGVVRQMKTHGAVDFCLLAGDLTENGKREDLAAVRQIFKGLGVPVYVQIGNHDYVSQTDRRAYEKLFPRRLNYYFKNNGWQFVGLDSTEGTRYQNTLIQADTFRWVRDHIGKLDKKAPLVIFTHFPLGNQVKYRPGNSDLILDFFREHNLQAVFSGHWHGFTERRLGQTTFTTNACCAFKRGNHDGTRKKGYFLCAAKDGQVSREFVEYKGKEASSRSS